MFSRLGAQVRGEFTTRLRSVLEAFGDWGLVSATSVFLFPPAPVKGGSHP